MTARSKLCHTCGVIKLAAEFWRDATQADGLQKKCRSCLASWRRTLRRERRERGDIPVARAFAKPAGADALGRNPIAWDPPGEADPELVGRARNVLCVHYDHCLDVTVRLNWLGFACTGCTAYQQIPAEQLRAEGEALARDRRAS